MLHRHIGIISDILMNWLGLCLIPRIQLFIRIEAWRTCHVALILYVN